MMSRRHTVTLTFLTLSLSWVGLFTATGQLQFDFDCRRLGIDCGGGECDVSKGICLCSNVTGMETNYRCQNETAFPCSKSTYGDNCSLERVQVDCRGDEMFVNINPDGDFDGLIYVFGKDNIDACLLKNSTTNLPDYVKNKDTIAGLQLALAYTNAECGDAVKKEETNGPITYSRQYFIQYNKNIKSSLDQKVSVNCIFTDGQAATIVQGQVEEVKQANSNFKDLNVDSDADTDVIEFVLKDKDDQPLKSNVDLGDEIKLVFTLTSDRGFVDFSLDSCSANNTIDDSSADYKSITFVDNNCPTAGGQALFKNGIIKSSDSNKITVSISAFMFSGSVSKVGFSCDIKLCREENKDECKKTTCAGITSDADKDAESQVKPSPSETPNNSSSVTTPDVENSNATTPDSRSSNATTPDNGSDSATTSANTILGTTAAPATNATGTTAAGNQPPNAGETTASNEGGANPTPGDRKRRRRAAGDEADPVKRVYSDMTVRDPSAIVEEPVTSTVEKDCLADPEILAIIAVLAVMVLALSFICLVVSCYLTKKGRFVKDTDHEDNRVANRNGSARGREMHARMNRGQSFTIPRLEIRSKRSIHNSATSS